MPAYPLHQVQQEVASQGSKAFTKKAIDSGRSELGLSVSEMKAIIAAANANQFYKSMTSHAIAGAYQDVYHLPTPHSQVAYAKFCLHQVSRVVVTFKEK